jgi:hypothetical protein
MAVPLLSKVADQGSQVQLPAKFLKFQFDRHQPIETDAVFLVVLRGDNLVPARKHHGNTVIEREHLEILVTISDYRPGYLWRHVVSLSSVEFLCPSLI